MGGKAKGEEKRRKCEEGEEGAMKERHTQIRVIIVPAESPVTP